MDGGKTKRVGGSRSLFRLMGEGEGEVEMESNFKDHDYQTLSKMIQTMNRKIDKFEHKLGGKEDVKEDYMRLREQVEHLSVRMDDIEVGDDFDEANDDKKKLFRLIEEANEDKKKLFRLVEEANEDKKKMLQLIEGVNARVEKLEIKFENEIGRSKSLNLDSPTPSRLEVDSDIRIYVGKLPRSVTECDLHDYFGEFRRITNVKLVVDKVTHLSRGVGFVTFKNEDSRRRVLCQGVHELHGSLVDVQIARPQKDSPKRYGGVRDSPKRYGTGSSAAATYDVSSGVQPQSYLLPKCYGAGSSAAATYDVSSGLQPQSYLLPKCYGAGSSAAATYDVSSGVQPQSYLLSGPSSHGYSFITPGWIYPYYQQ